MLDLPTNLKGISSLWRLITLNNNQEVISKSLEFLNNLHTVIEIINYNYTNNEFSFKKRILIQLFQKVKISSKGNTINKRMNIYRNRQKKVVIQKE